ncbi:hypothetical protein AHAT_22050 [Agarivorans sp. Toyoura001]|nr:hypothetical protein AHAT_22050 [Agarivorans sp. Toyoura001]
MEHALKPMTNNKLRPNDGVNLITILIGNEVLPAASTQTISLITLAEQAALEHNRHQFTD